MLTIDSASAKLGGGAGAAGSELALAGGAVIGAGVASGGCYLASNPNRGSGSGNSNDSIRLRSRIYESSKLAREAERTGRSHQGDLDRSTEELVRGNRNPGIGNRPIGKGMSESRTRNGARVYWRRATDGVIEILGKSGKDNRAEVIREIHRVFGM